MNNPYGLQVHKILGPGNQYVTAAKMALQNSEAMISMDMPAGPSEVLVIADAAASAAHVAADLLSQAEHGPDSQVGHHHCFIVPHADMGRLHTHYAIHVCLRLCKLLTCCISTLASSSRVWN